MFSRIILSVILILLSTNCSKKTENVTIPKIGIIQHAENTILDKVRTGFIDQLAELGYKDGENISIDYENAQTMNTTNRLIAANYINSGVDLIFAIATPTAQAAKALTDSIPIIFGAISDPISAGLVKSNEIPGGNATGTSDVWPFKNQFKLFKDLLPNLEIVGVVHNPGESNSVYNMILTRKAVKELNLNIVEASVSNTSEVYLAAQSLIGRCDALYIPSDNTAITAAASIIQVGLNNNIPVFAGESGSVEEGAIATLGTNYYEIGKESGKMAYEVLFENKSPSSLSVRLAEKADLIINLNAAKKFGINIDESIIEEAQIVIK